MLEASVPPSLEGKMLEGLKETLEAREPFSMVEKTRIEGFERSGFTSNENIAEQLREALPPSHFDDMSLIRFEPAPVAENPALAYRFHPETRAIDVFAGNEKGERAVFERLSHAMGNKAYETMQNEAPGMTEHWNDLHETSRAHYEQDGSGYVSEGACEGAREDFAESYASYVNNPETLKFYAPEKHNFIHHHVFNGKTPQVSFSGRPPTTILTSAMEKFSEAAYESLSPTAKMELVQHLVKRFENIITHLGVDKAMVTNTIEHLLEKGVAAKDVGIALLKQ